MVNDVMKRTDRLNLARAILRAEVARATGNPDRFTALDYTKAARIYLASTRHNTERLERKLAHLIRGQTNEA